MVHVRGTYPNLLLSQDKTPLLVFLSHFDKWYLYKLYGKMLVLSSTGTLFWIEKRCLIFHVTIGKSMHVLRTSSWHEQMNHNKYAKEAVLYLLVPMEVTVRVLVQVFKYSYVCTVCSQHFRYSVHEKLRMEALSSS